MRAVMAFLAHGRLTSHPGLKTGLRARFSGQKIEPSWVSTKRTLGTSSGAPKPAEIPYFFHHVPRISTTPNSSQYKHSTAEQRGRRFSKWNVAPLFVPG